MLGRTLNLGILAHVDAGKTTLTERLLYAAGVISTPGSVDHGTTQTDTLDLERQRGITIRAAVATFRVADVAVNLIDTPGHPDFIAEVERSLSVLDGAVLVVSAVEGVQAQTLVLMRALRRLRIPALIFVNKCDRAGADPERVLGQIHARLVSSAIPMWAVDAAQLAEHDEALLAAYVDGAAIDVRRSLAALSRAGAVHPVFAGSAITGAGVEPLLAGIAELLPATAPAGGPLAASVFKIERAAGGEKVAYVRVFSGAIRVRDRFGEEKVTAAEVFEPGGPKRAASIDAGQIGKVRGLRSIRVGDRLGGAGGLRRGTQFAPPTLQSVVDPLDPDEGQALRVALDQLAEQDPLIAVRQDGEQLSVSIYGEVQKEVLEATLRHDYGLAVAFRETRPIHVERPCGLAEATVLLNAPGNPFHAQLGLRVEPGEGVEVRFEIADHSRVPLYVYKRREEFEAAMDAYVRDALRHGLHGWEVIDCRVTVFDCWYSLADGPPSRRGPMPTAGDFRGLTPRVLRQALEHAGTVVCEPIDRVRIELPADALGATMAAASRLGADVEAPSVDGASASVEGVLPSVRVAELRRQLPSLTRGEGVAESSFAGYRPAVSAVPG